MFLLGSLHLGDISSWFQCLTHTSCATPDTDISRRSFTEIFPDDEDIRYRLLSHDQSLLPEKEQFDKGSLTEVPSMPFPEMNTSLPSFSN